MHIAWITAKTDSALIAAFREARWKYRVIAPMECMPFSRWNLHAVDVILIDIMDRSTLEICCEICDQQLAPVLALVDDLAYAQAALEAGANDFIVVPLNPIEAVLRARKLARIENIIRVGNLEIDLGSGSVISHGNRIHLSVTEFRLLTFLAKRAGQMVAQATILEEMRTAGAEQKTPGQVKTYIGRLRRKIEPDSQNPQYIITIPGTGYRLRNQRQWEARRHEVPGSELFLKVPS